MHLNVKTKVPKQWLLSTLTVNALLSQTPSPRHMGPTLSIKYTTSNTQSPRGNKYSLLYSDLVFPPKTRLKTCFATGVDIDFKHLPVALHLLMAGEMLPG